MNAYSSEFHQGLSEAEGSAPPGKGAAGEAEGMSAPPREPSPEGDSDLAPDLAGAMAQRWSALHGAAVAVAGLAQIAPDVGDAEAPDFAAFISAAPTWKVDLLRNGLDDIAAIMQSGLTALLAVNASGSDPAAAATALCAEFKHSRDALLESVMGQ